MGGLGRPLPPSVCVTDQSLHSDDCFTLVGDFLSAFTVAGGALTACFFVDSETLLLSRGSSICCCAMKIPGRM